jgi:glycosyltransferase involved in cell wall biosynthesis
VKPLKAEPRRAGGIYLGELNAESGVATLREALDLYPGARVQVIGRSDLDSDELAARLQRAAYLVLPTLTYDPMPRPLVEAFANGVPVIASRVGTLAELIEPGRNGLLFEPGSARELARRLAWADAFPEKMRQMGECARADYQARFIAQWSYQTLFGERRRSARV